MFAMGISGIPARPFRTKAVRIGSWDAGILRSVVLLGRRRVLSLQDLVRDSFA